MLAGNRHCIVHFAAAVQKEAKPENNKKLMFGNIFSALCFEIQL